jgi:hypothetical protein
MTKPREWPNYAKEIRDRTAEEAMRGMRAIKPLLDGKELTELDRLRRVAIATDSFHTILRLLESVGAQTRP